MKRFRYTSLVATLLTFSFLFSSCSAIEGIFKAGVWVGILMVAGVVILLVSLLGRSKK